MMTTKTIKAGLSVILSLCLTTPLICQTAANSAAVRPSLTVEFENEILSLAKGYEKAFEELPSGGKYLEVSTSSGPKYLRGSVRSVKAFEGVLFIRMDKGPIHVVSARDVIRITNEKP